MAPEDTSILLTLREKERWEEREAQLSDPEDREMASRQVDYYQRLVRRMKRTVSPTTLSSVFEAFLR